MHTIFPLIQRVIVIWALVWGGLSTGFASDDSAPLVTRSNPQQVRFRFEVKTENPTPFKQVFSVIMPYPVSGAFQDIEYSEEPENIVAMPDGKGFYSDTVVVLDPGEKRTVVTEYTATVYDLDTDFSRITMFKPYDTSSVLYQTYTGKELPYTDPENKALDKVYAELDAAAETDLEFARAAFDYVAITIKNYSSGHHNLEKSLRTRSGSCIDGSGIFSSLLRRRGIPVRIIGGYQTNGLTHARNDFYLEGYGWIPVEVSNKIIRPEDGLFGKIRGDQLARVIDEVSSGGWYFVDDEYGFCTSVPRRTMLPVAVYTDGKVKVSISKTIIPIIDGQPGPSKRLR